MCFCINDSDCYPLKQILFYNGSDWGRFLWNVAKNKTSLSANFRSSLEISTHCVWEIGWSSFEMGKRKSFLATDPHPYFLMLHNARKMDRHNWANTFLKFVNLQYIMLGCLDDGTSKSSTKSLMFRVHIILLYFF